MDEGSSSNVGKHHEDDCVIVKQYLVQHIVEPACVVISLMFCLHCIREQNARSHLEDHVKQSLEETKKVKFALQVMQSNNEGTINF